MTRYLVLIGERVGHMTGPAGGHHPLLGLGPVARGRGGHNLLTAPRPELIQKIIIINTCHT